MNLAAATLALLRHRYRCIKRRDFQSRLRDDGVRQVVGQGQRQFSGVAPVDARVDYAGSRSSR